MSSNHDNDAWTALCAFAKDPERRGDYREPWEVPTARRKRKVSLARAMKQADKAGLSVTAATLTADGVELHWSEASANTSNEWDSVQ